MEKRYLDNGHSVSINGDVYDPKGVKRKLFPHNKHGNLRVNIKGKNYYVKKLMASLYLEGYDPLIHGVYMINGDVTDLRLENLEYRIKSKKIHIDLDYVEQKRKQGFNIKAIADELGVDWSTLYKRIKAAK